MIQKNIARIRKERGLTQAQLASLAAIPSSTLSAIEAGSNTTISMVEKIIDALDTSWEEVVKNVPLTPEEKLEATTRVLRTIASNGYWTESINELLDTIYAQD